jgi:hypothetical protein
MWNKLCRKKKNKRVNFTVDFILSKQESQADWDQKASSTIHAKKIQKTPKCHQKVLFLHFVWEIEKATTTNVALLLWPVHPCTGVVKPSLKSPTNTCHMPRNTEFTDCMTGKWQLCAVLK